MLCHFCGCDSERVVTVVRQGDHKPSYSYRNLKRQILSRPPTSHNSSFKNSYCSSTHTRQIWKGVLLAHFVRPEAEYMIPSLRISPDTISRRGLGLVHVPNV